MHSAPLSCSDEASVTCFSPLPVDYTLNDTTLRPPDSRVSGWPLHSANIPTISARAEVGPQNGPNNGAFTINDDVPPREKEHHNQAAQQPNVLRTELSRSQLGSVTEKLPIAYSNDLNKPFDKNSGDNAINIDKHSSVQEISSKYLPSHTASTQSKPLLGTIALERGVQVDETPSPAEECFNNKSNSENNYPVNGVGGSNLLEVHKSQKGNKTGCEGMNNEAVFEAKRDAGRQVLGRSSTNTVRQAGTEDERGSQRGKKDPLMNRTFEQIEAGTTTHDAPNNDAEDKENYIMNKNCESSKTTVASERASIEVFPPELSVEAGAAAAVVLVNRTPLRRTLQVSSSHPCLVAEPVVASVGPQGSVSVRLTLQQRLHCTTHAVLTVKCNGHQSSVKVTCLPFVQSTASADKHSVAGLQVGQSALSFPITSAGKQAHVKLSLKNLCSTTKQVIATVTSGGGSFVVKHPHFQVKVGHFVNVPVYFRPRYAGDHTGELRLAVGEEGEFGVQLAGSCV